MNKTISILSTLCIGLTIALALSFLSIQNLIVVTHTSVAGWDQCISQSLVKLDRLEAARKENIRVLFGERQIEP